MTDLKEYAKQVIQIEAEAPVRGDARRFRLDALR
jgi:hypothetical protein